MKRYALALLFPAILPLDTVSSQSPNIVLFRGPGIAANTHSHVPVKRSRKG